MSAIIPDNSGGYDLLLNKIGGSLSNHSYPHDMGFPYCSYVLSYWNLTSNITIETNRASVSFYHEITNSYFYSTEVNFRNSFNQSGKGLYLINLDGWTGYKNTVSSDAEGGQYQIEIYPMFQMTDSYWNDTYASIRPTDTPTSSENYNFFNHGFDFRVGEYLNNGEIAKPLSINNQQFLCIIDIDKVRSPFKIRYKVEGPFNAGTYEFYHKLEFSFYPLLIFNNDTDILHAPSHWWVKE